MLFEGRRSAPAGPAWRVRFCCSPECWSRATSVLDHGLAIVVRAESAARRSGRPILRTNCARGPERPPTTTALLVIKTCHRIHNCAEVVWVPDTCIIAVKKGALLRSHPRPRSSRSPASSSSRWFSTICRVRSCSRRSPSGSPPSPARGLRATTSTPQRVRPGSRRGLLQPRAGAPQMVRPLVLWQPGAEPTVTVQKPLRVCREIWRKESRTGFSPPRPGRDRSPTPLIFRPN